MVVALVAVTVLQHVTTDVYSLTPGVAQPVAPLITVSGLATDPPRDNILLTDVYLTPLSAWQWLTSHLQSHVQYVTSGQLVEPGIPTSELNAQGYLERYDSKEAAEVSALRALGWTIPSTPDGAVVVGVVASSPAHSAGVHVADRVVALNGRAVTTACSLVRAMEPVRPGNTVSLALARARVSASGSITWRATRVVRLRVTRSPPNGGQVGCGGLHADRAWLGVEIEDGVHYSLPGRITINTADIGGPSAGLAMALTLVELLSSGSITGRTVVAATGTISPSGLVGDVGGVAEKTIAVERAGATLFLVPPVEVATARAAASPGLTVMGVSSLAQALLDLRERGGAPPTPLTRPR
ncbi:MAG TPA: PDZ domain-containing protein [Acidimicrobiales bacterium]|nr:PDZ domain-containing protein [Acidimicrobiales bacterium]